MSVDIAKIGAQKVKSVTNGQAVELKSFWEDQNVAIVFFRRWGCMFCRLWAKELSEIAPVLQKNNIKLIGIGVEEVGSEEFVKKKFFDGDLYYVENISTYHQLGFKRFNVVSLIGSLFWKKSRDAISKGRGMDLGGDLKGDWVQVGGALLVQKGGNVLRHFVQAGPGEHLPNADILKHFNLEHEYNPETMANKNREEAQCTAALVILCVWGAVAEPPAPYAPSGWRPDGPAFDLPQRGPQPLPLDPRNPLPPATSYGVPEDDVSVQGLPPPQEQQPIFQSSPISGKQYAGPAFNTDLKDLDQSFKQSQYQQQQERYRESQRQKQLEAAQNSPNGNRLPVPQNPRQFASRPSSTTTTTTKASSTPVPSTTELNLNQGEVRNDDKPAKLKNPKTSVEITKQNVQEYPGEFFLNSLAQIQLQPQFVPLQQLSGAYLQPQGASQKQVAGFDAATHFAALPSILAQQNLQPQNPALLVQSREQVLIPQSYQPQIQTQLQPDPVVLQAPAQYQPNFYAQPNPDAVAVQQPAQQFPVNSYQPALQPNPDAVAIQPQYQPQPQGFQIQAQPVIYQPQPSQFAQPAQPQPQPNKEAEDDVENVEQQNQNNQQQFFQRPIIVQPQVQYQPQQFPAQLIQNQEAQFQPQPQYQPQQLQPEIQYLQPQNQYLQPQAQFNQPQGQFNQPQGQFNQPQGQFVQPEAQPVQPQGQYQPQFLQPQFLQPENQYLQPQAQPQGQFSQGQFAQQGQGQDALQSGLDINQEGNDLDQEEEKESEPEGATAVATAFGTRTQPRLQPKYGAPFPAPRVQANPNPNTETPVEEITEDGPAVAQATAVANGERRKSARLRGRRVRPVYAVDRSGRLVFAEAQ